MQKSEQEGLPAHNHNIPRQFSRIVHIKEEHEIRVLLKDEKGVLASGKNIREYTLVDRYFVPVLPDENWKPERKNLRLRKFGHRNAEIVLSVPEFRGIVKYGKKYFIAEGEESTLTELLLALGFKEVFQIPRKIGYFMNYMHWDIALEFVEGLGWMIDVDVDGEADARQFIASLGNAVKEVLTVPLPACFCKTFNIKI